MMSLAKTAYYNFIVKDYSAHHVIQVYMSVATRTLLPFKYDNKTEALQPFQVDIPIHQLVPETFMELNLLNTVVSLNSGYCTPNNGLACVHFTLTDAFVSSNFPPAESVIQSCVRICRIYRTKICQNRQVVRYQLKFRAGQSRGPAP